MKKVNQLFLMLTFIVCLFSQTANSITAKPDLKNGNNQISDNNFFGGAPPLSGDYIVGTAPSAYLTITAAVNALNSNGVSGPVRFLLKDASYPSETFPITIQGVAGLSAVNSVTIKPDNAVTSTISGVSANSPIFKILSSYISIDGSSTFGGTTRDLTISNTSTTSPKVILIGSTGTTPVVGDSIKNCIIQNGSINSTGLIVSDGAVSGNAGYFNNITIQNNSILQSYFGIYCRTVSAAGNGSGLNISSNEFDIWGSIRNTGIYLKGIDGAAVSNNSIGNFETDSLEIDKGIWIDTNTVNSTISGNNINNLSYTGTGAYAPVGIYISTVNSNSNNTISGNIIDGILTTGSETASGISIRGGTGNITISRNKINYVNNLYATGGGCNGIQLSSTSVTANIKVVNNVIYDIVSAQGKDANSVSDNGYGIIVTSGAGYSIYNNSVSINTNSWDVVGYPAAFNVTSGVTTAGAIDVRNNIFANSQTSGTQRYSIYCGAATTVFSAIDNNDYYTAGTNLGFIASDRLNLAAWKTGTGKDNNSYSGDPAFTSAINLMPVLSNANCWNLNGKGTPLSAVSTDFDGNARSTTVAGGPTDIGAYEFTPTVAPPVTLPTGTIGSGNTTIYSQSGRTIIDIKWLNGPGLIAKRTGDNTESKFVSETDNVPSTVNVKYYSGITPPDTATGIMKKTGKSIWYVQYNTAVDSSDITVYYGLQELGNIPDESDLILAKYDSTTRIWVPFSRYVSGDSTGRSVVNTTLKTIHVRQGQAGNASGVYTLTSSANPLKRFRFDITAIMSGYWYNHGSGSSTQMSDTLSITLRDTISPFSSSGTFKVVVDTLGIGYALTALPNAGGWYYAQINQLNSLETWTKVWAMPRTTGKKIYDMTSAQTQAYGNNLIPVGGKWCLISGDVNQDKYIDGSDYLDIINYYDTALHLAGDTNGDLYIDGSDYLAVINHYDMGSITPSTPMEKRLKLSLAREK